MDISTLITAWAMVSPAAAPADGAAPNLAPVRVIVVGLDAVSFNVLDPLIEAGLVPHLAELSRTGARGELASIWPLRTPQVWTTVVTGKYPGQHGIWDHVSNSRYNPPKFRTTKKKVLTTRERRSKALWNILDARGKSVVSVGWIATWPAEKLSHGVMAAPIVLEDSSKQVSIKGTFWRDRNSQIQPAELWPTVRAAIVEGPDLERADLAAFADVPEDGHPILKLPYMGKYITALKWSVARARTIEALTLALAPERHPDLLLLYFQCGDSLLHRFWVFHKSVDEIRERLDTHGIPTDHAAELQQRFGRVVQACYQDMDERIGRILEKTRDDNTLVLVISDHGFGEAPFPHPTKTEPYGGNHRDHGVILAAAPWIEPGTTLEGATVLDLMPTLLHLYGAPVASDMPGKLLEPLVPPAVRARKPEVIPSYENKPQTKIPYKNGWPARKFRPLAEDS